MGLFSSPPHISVRMPPAIFAGSDVDVLIDVTAEEPTPVDHVSVRLRGVQGWSTGAGKNRRARRETYPDLRFRISEAGSLPAGTTTIPCRFKLPPDVPPTHDIDPAYAYLEMRVHISIPWRWDARGRFTLPVRMPAPPYPVPRSPTIAVDQSGSSADDPRLELGLASTRIIVGETVRGSCALFHMSDDEPRHVHISLVPRFVLKGRVFDGKREGKAFEMALTIPPGGAGRAIPFQFTVPSSTPPGFDAVSHTLSWRLVAETRGLFTRKVGVAVDVDVIDASATAVSGPPAFAPALGDRAVAAVFDGFATDMWRLAGRSRDDADDADDAGDGDPRGPAVEREIAGSTVRIAYRYRGQDGTFLVARVDHPALGLGLAVTPGSALRHVFFADLECGVKEFDRAFLVGARAHDQARPFVAAVAPVVLRATALGSMVRWDDDAMTFERPVTSIDVRMLQEMSFALVELASTLEPAIEQIAPPPRLVVDRAAWRALAGWLDGALAIGDLSVDGRLGDQPVQVRMVWNDDGDPAGLRVAIGSAATASAALRGVSLSLPRPGPDALGHPSAERLVALLAAWPADLVDLRIADGVAAATWRLPENRDADAGRVRALVEALRAVLATLEPSAGPYR